MNIYQVHVVLSSTCIYSPVTHNELNRLASTYCSRNSQVSKYFYYNIQRASLGVDLFFFIFFIFFLLGMYFSPELNLNLGRDERDVVFLER